MNAKDAKGGNAEGEEMGENGGWRWSDSFCVLDLRLDLFFPLNLASLAS
jgi:hypothetical protein